MLPEELKVELLRGLEARLPRGVRILLLSLCGARGYGWGFGNLDWDVAGVADFGGGIDYAHLSFNVFDVNLYDARYIAHAAIEGRAGDTILNLLNPFYAVEGFPVEGLIRVLTPSFFPPEGLRHQIDAFRVYGHPRYALHAYRLAAVPLHLFKKGRLEYNVFRAMEGLGWSTELARLCARIYAGEVAPPAGWREHVLGELAGLADEYERETRGAPGAPPEDAVRRVREAIEALLRG